MPPRCASSGFMERPQSVSASTCTAEQHVLTLQVRGHAAALLLEWRHVAAAVRDRLDLYAAVAALIRQGRIAWPLGEDALVVLGTARRRVSAAKASDHMGAAGVCAQ
jgi:hypothetical protein